MLVLSLFTDVMNHKPRFAWELYLKMETSGESFSLLQLIANDCYKVLYVLCVNFTHCLNRLGKVMICHTVKSKEKSKKILKNEIHAQTKLLPHFNSKARQLSTQLYNGLFMSEKSNC